MQDRIKKLLMGIAALGALAAGGSALAGASSNSSTTTAGTAQTESVDKPDTQEASDKLSTADAAKAEKAALAAVGEGKVTESSAEQADDPADKSTDKPEAGDTPDPAYESKIAFDVEVTKTDGSVVDVHLDKGFNVLGTEKADTGDGDGEHAGDAGEHGKDAADQD